MSVLRQSLVVSRLSLSSLGQRFGSAFVVVIGMACVVGVLLAMLAATAGMVRAFRNSGDAGRALIVPALTHGDAKTGLTREALGSLLDAPGIARDSAGHALADGELDQQLPPAAGFAEGTLLLRGVGPAGIALRPQFTIVAGRMFGSGRHEVITGIGAARVFGIRPGDMITTRQGDWPVVGEFSDGGGVLESQLIGDAESIMTTWKRPTYDLVLVRLRSAAAFEPFKRWLITNPALSVDAVRESEWYQQMSRHRTPFFTAMAYLVGGIMALGALIGGMRIMYASVSARTREIATLRAIGYDALPVALSVIAECALLSLAGAVLGALLAWLLFDGRHSSLGEAVFDLYVSPALLGAGLGWALLIAILGGLLPAVRAARVPVADALRAG